MSKYGIQLDAVARTKELFEKNPDEAKKVNRIVGKWDSQNARFSSNIQVGENAYTLEADIPPFLGGKGEKPGALHYCLFGSAACYAGTLMTIAEEEGVDLGDVTFTIENVVNFRKVLGISEEPIVEEVRITVEVTGDVDESTLASLKEKADEQCPGMYCLTRPIPVKTAVVTSK